MTKEETYINSHGAESKSETGLAEGELGQPRNWATVGNVIEANITTTTTTSTNHSEGKKGEAGGDKLA